MKNVQVYLKEIKKDVMKSVLYNLLRSLRWFALILIAMVIEFFFLPDIPLIAIGSIPLFVEVILCVIDLCITVSDKKIKITMDVLSNKRARGGIGNHGSRNRRPARLIFNFEGHYDIHYDLTYYRWSSINTMNENDLIETSCIGDTFTIVKIRNKIRAVYNHRFFDVQYSET